MNKLINVNQEVLLYETEKLSREELDRISNQLAYPCNQQRIKRACEVRDYVRWYIGAVNLQQQADDLIKQEMRRMWQGR